MRHILIAEGVHIGHRLYFVRMVTLEALRRGETVTLCIPATAVESPEFAATLSDLPCELVIEETPTDPATLTRVSRQHRSDVVIVLDADRMISRLARHRRWHGAGTLRLLMLRSRMPHRGADRLHRIRVAIKRILIMRVDHMRRVEVFHLVPSRLGASYGRREIGDPVEWAASSAAVADWRARLGSEHFWFGVFGVITERKNLPLVLRALETLRSRDAARVGVLIAGQLDPDVQSALSEFRATSMLPIHVVDRLLDEEELDSAVAAVDCVVLAHSNEGSSGILGKAVRSGTRVLAAGAATLRDACEDIGDGALWSSLDETDLIGAASQMLTRPRPDPQDLRSNLTHEFLRVKP